MAKTLDDVSRNAVALSEVDRFRLARILLSQPEQSRVVEEGEDEWEREIERRLAELESGSVKGVPLDEFKARMEKKFGREG